VLARLERHATLDAALADCGFVLGTTARPRAVRHERMTPRQAAPALLSAAGRDLATPAAVLFGPEDRGLSNAALGRCNAVVTIPTAPDDPSLNLAQSALVIAYELWLAATTDASLAHIPDAAAALITTPTMEPLAPGTAREEMDAAPSTTAMRWPAARSTGTSRWKLARTRASVARCS